MPKVISPIVEQDLKARGVAQVIVVLKQPAAIGAALDASIARSIEPHFRWSERSHAGAIRHALLARGVAAAALPDDRPAQIYPNLGLMLGTVDREGLAALQASDSVATISGSPQISLIRPKFAAAATPRTGATWGITALRVPALWDQGLTGKNIRVAHLDTGVDGRHPALKKAIAAFAEFELTLGRRITPDPAPHDSGEHGTHTAATIAGRPVAGKHVGVAYGAALYSALVIEGGNVVARVLGGLDWAVGTGARIVSMSLGFPGWWEDFIPVVQILRSRGMLPVIAVGNEGPGTSRSPGNYPDALSVGAHDDRLDVADFSSSQRFDRSQDPVVPDLVAPGVNVISARPQNRYQSMSGTSMATPHIAGLAALLWEADPAKSASEVERAIFESCRLVGTMTADRANRGMPDAVAAYEHLTGHALTPGGKKAAAAAKPRARATARKGSRKRRVTRGR